MSLAGYTIGGTNNGIERLDTAPVFNAVIDLTKSPTIVSETAARAAGVALLSKFPRHSKSVWWSRAKVEFGAALLRAGDGRVRLLTVGVSEFLARREGADIILGMDFLGAWVLRGDHRVAVKLRGYQLTSRGLEHLDLAEVSVLASPSGSRAPTSITRELATRVGAIEIVAELSAAVRRPNGRRAMVLVSQRVGDCDSRAVIVSVDDEAARQRGAEMVLGALDRDEERAVFGDWRPPRTKAELLRQLTPAPPT